PGRGRAGRGDRTGREAAAGAERGRAGRARAGDQAGTCYRAVVTSTIRQHMLRLATLLSLVAVAGAAASPAGSPLVVTKIRVGAKPCASVAAKGLLWVTNYGSSPVSVIDPAKNRVVGKPIRVDPGPCGIVAGAGSIWTHAFNSDRVDRINPRSRRVTQRIRIGRGSFDVLFAAGSLWGTNNTDHTPQRVPPARDPALHTSPLRPRPPPPPPPAP